MDTPEEVPFNFSPVLVTEGVTNSGESLNTSAPVPVSSLITLANSADVVEAN